MSTLSELKERLALYKETERRILTDGQSYGAGTAGVDRHKTSANLAQVQSQIRELEQQIAMHPEAGGRLSHSSAVFGGRR
ncbi:MAG: hypothetical protein FWD79_11745 [Desulfobulbus sp.]|nr:hypothetical protein [Desulfobulbus sp.]